MAPDGRTKAADEGGRRIKGLTEAGGLRPDTELNAYIGALIGGFSTGWEQDRDFSVGREFGP